MKKSWLLISVLILASCATQHVFNTEQAKSYLMSHKDRPVHIQEALSVGKLARGMNEEEVQICWGKPHRIETKSFPRHEFKFWRYLEEVTIGHTYGPRLNKGSIDRKVLSKEVRFMDGFVDTWREINTSS